MDYDYGRLESLTQEEFKKMCSAKPAKQTTLSDDADIKKIERLLDLQDGSLAKQKLSLEKTTCKCGRTLTFYDFVFSSLVDAGHTKSFVTHTLLGSKFFVNKPRRIRCSSCGELSPQLADYETPQYGCCRP